jgi:hypothetical protein
MSGNTLKCRVFVDVVNFFTDGLVNVNQSTHNINKPTHDLLNTWVFLSKLCGVLLIQHILIIFRAQYGALLVQTRKNLNVSAFSCEYILTCKPIHEFNKMKCLPTFVNKWKVWQRTFVFICKFQTHPEFAAKRI